MEEATRHPNQNYKLSDSMDAETGPESLRIGI